MYRFAHFAAALFLVFSAPSAFALSSAAIRDSISHQIDSVSLGGHEIDIAVSRGTVTLKGFVGSEAARREVENLATNTEGVERVESFLTVQPSGNSAQQALARAVWNNIQTHGNLGTYKIQILGTGDKVVLTGTAASEQIKLALENIARQTPGVRTVENSISIGG